MAKGQGLRSSGLAPGGVMVALRAVQREER